MSPSHPWSAALLANATASDVVSAEIDATTGPRLRTASTEVRRIACFSSNDTVAPSPSEPSATIPEHPLSSSQRLCSAMKP
jgi:hypothetical protein